MDFQVLGPVGAHADDRALVLQGPKARALLAVLLLHPNEAVSAERLAVDIWGEDTPAAAANRVQLQVSRLRKALGADGVLETTPAGYRLRVAAGQLDADRFGALVVEG